MGRRAILVACAVAAATAVPIGAEPVDLALVLSRAATYIDAFIDGFSNVVSEERYVQEATPGLTSFSQLGGRGAVTAALPRNQKRTLRSDFLLVRPPDSSDWMPFRDVFEVDGFAIRDREGRLAKLFLTSSANASALEKAKAIGEESSRYNIGNILRTINNPVIALAFLTRDDQRRFVFSMGKADPSAGPNVWMVEYQERARPTFIRGINNADMPTRGRAWIDAENGHVVKTEFLLEDSWVSAKVTTTFKADERLRIHVPAEMLEEYRLSAGGHVTGKATYGRFRQFGVKTDEEIEKPTERRLK